MSAAVAAMAPWQGHWFPFAKLAAGQPLSSVAWRTAIRHAILCGRFPVVPHWSPPYETPIKKAPLLLPQRGTTTAPYHTTKAAPTEGLLC